MITWHKFSERQPEKDGYYLFFFWKFAKVRGSFIYQVFRDNSFFYSHPEGVLQTTGPDYWAEINPPGGCENCDPSTMYPGKLVFTDKKGNCQKCGKPFIKEPPMPEKPMCKDCRWLTGDQFGRMDRDRVLCGSPKAPRSPIDGDPNTGCWYLRNAQLTAGGVLTEPENCGPEGRWFEAKDREVEKSPNSRQIKGHAHVLGALLSDGPPFRSGFTAGEWQALLGLLERLSS